MSNSPSSKRLIRILTGAHAGKEVIAYCDFVHIGGVKQDGLKVPELGLEFPSKSSSRSYRPAVVKDTIEPGDDYEDLFGCFDGRGDRLEIGARVYYAKENQVRRGTVEGFGNRSSYSQRKVKIREDLDVRDYDWQKNGGIFILNTSYDCLIIPEQEKTQEP